MTAIMRPSVTLTNVYLYRKPVDFRKSAIPHAYTTSVTAYKKHHTQGAATAAYVLRYVIFPKNSTIYHEHTKYIRLRTLVIPRGLMKRGELVFGSRSRAWPYWLNKNWVITLLADICMLLPTATAIKSSVYSGKIMALCCTTNLHDRIFGHPAP